DIAVTLGYGPDLGDEFTILTASNGINICDFPTQVSAPFGPFDIYFFDVICNNNSIVLKVETILLGVTDFDDSPVDFYVYPNPVKDSSEIYFSSPDTNSQYDELSVSIYNMLGQKIKHIEGFLEENNSFKKENLSSGIYF